MQGLGIQQFAIKLGADLRAENGSATASGAVGGFIGELARSMNTSIASLVANGSELPPTGINLPQDRPASIAVPEASGQAVSNRPSTEWVLTEAGVTAHNAVSETNADSVRLVQPLALASSISGSELNRDAGSATSGVVASPVTANQITANQITANLVTANQVPASQVTTGPVTAGPIAANQVTANQVTANQVTANQVTANQVTAGPVAPSLIASRMANNPGLSGGSWSTTSPSASPVPTTATRLDSPGARPEVTIKAPLGSQNITFGPTVGQEGARQTVAQADLSGTANARPSDVSTTSAKPSPGDQLAVPASANRAEIARQIGTSSGIATLPPGMQDGKSVASSVVAMTERAPLSARIADATSVDDPASRVSKAMLVDAGRSAAGADGSLPIAARTALPSLVVGTLAPGQSAVPAVIAPPIATNRADGLSGQSQVATVAVNGVEVRRPAIAQINSSPASVSPANSAVRSGVDWLISQVIPGIAMAPRTAFVDMPAANTSTAIRDSGGTIQVPGSIPASGLGSIAVPQLGAAVSVLQGRPATDSPDQSGVVAKGPNSATEAIPVELARELATNTKIRPPVAAKADIGLDLMGDRAQVSVAQLQKPIVDTFAVAAATHPKDPKAISANVPPLAPTIGASTVLAAAAPLATDRSGVAESGAPINFLLQAGKLLADPALGQKLGRRLLSMLGNRASSAKIQITPPHLGALELKISTEDDGIKVVIVTQQIAVKEAIDDSVARLRQLFQDQGQNLLDVEVQHRDGKSSKNPERQESINSGDSFVREADEAQRAIAGSEQTRLLDLHA